MNSSEEAEKPREELVGIYVIYILSIILSICGDLMSCSYKARLFNFPSACLCPMIILLLWLLWQPEKF